MNVSFLREQLNEVQDRINKACDKSNRDYGDVTLIAVSKTKPVEMLQEVYDCGCRHFGENKVQEMVDKMEVLPKDIQWHMIGHLQRNKVKYIVGRVAYIHSVDSLRLAEEISKEAVKKNCVVKILAEINVAGESSKFGTSDWNENLSLLESIYHLPGIELCGLMTIAPFTETPESNRIYFKQLHDFAYGEAKQYLPDNPLLSMGMTGDYEVAIEEGATYVRVGTGIFGQRNYGNI